MAAPPEVRAEPAPAESGAFHNPSVTRAIDATASQREETEAMDLRLADEVAVVTGASKGIGLAVTRALLSEGVNVVAARTLSDDLSQPTTRGKVHPV
jgi:NADP-dependent 3-hydroxy acid dehydrogenase YdfG